MDKYKHKKLSTEAFLKSYKHGVYIFVSDSCQFCKDYVESLTYLDDCRLNIVEAVTDSERVEISKVLDRVGFPITAGFWDDEVKLIKRGQLFGRDLEEVRNFLRGFPTEEISEEEGQKLKDSVGRKYVFGVCIFPEDVPFAARDAEMRIRARKNYEILVDCDNFYGATENPRDPKTDAEALYRLADRIIAYNIFNTSEYSSVGNELLSKYGAGLQYNDKILIPLNLERKDEKE